jgi:hypothetical protein
MVDRKQRQHDREEGPGETFQGTSPPLWPTSSIRPHLLMFLQSPKIVLPTGDQALNTGMYGDISYSNQNIRFLLGVSLFMAF